MLAPQEKQLIAFARTADATTPLPHIDHLPATTRGLLDLFLTDDLGHDSDDAFGVIAPRRFYEPHFAFRQLSLA